MEANQPLEDMVAQDPAVRSQMGAHWIWLAVVVAGLVATTVLTQGHLLSEAQKPTRAVLMLPVVFALSHGALCIGAVFWHTNQVRNLRRDSGSDRARLAQTVHYLSRRRLVIALLALVGQAVVVFAAVRGLDFASTPWLILELVPSFLLLSLGLRQIPTPARLVTHVKRLRLVQQDQLGR